MISHAVLCVHTDCIDKVKCSSVRIEHCVIYDNPHYSEGETDVAVM